MVFNLSECSKVYIISGRDVGAILPCQLGPSSLVKPVDLLCLEHKYSKLKLNPEPGICYRWIFVECTRKLATEHEIINFGAGHQPIL